MSFSSSHLTTWGGDLRIVCFEMDQGSNVGVFTTQQSLQRARNGTLGPLGSLVH